MKVTEKWGKMGKGYGMDMGLFHDVGHYMTLYDVKKCYNNIE